MIKLLIKKCSNFAGRVGHSFKWLTGSLGVVKYLYQICNNDKSLLKKIMILSKIDVSFTKHDINLKFLNLLQKRLKSFEFLHEVLHSSISTMYTNFN